ncbi:hypothetical protein L227DRAFT_655338 [Lentinus tigrinus ALCF2SS1-6]|uniref:Fungal-type protein kinase domain-containing protein n=1 Tax=Lentinus tigrinus ALCF2SS1-6 TaxID=1328759 RepID=A0A5C2S2V8_9APHY|nr:hypothetical protein L227DRAFT_655338 [Lentinus tigrinus ALCF2SS1-6]
MHGKYTLLSFDDFMKEFVPSPSNRQSARVVKKSSRTNIFSKLETAENEEQMYNSIPKVLNKGNLCPNFTFVATPGKVDKSDPTRQSVDLGMYPSTLAPKRPSDGSHARIDWSSVDIPIECKDHPTNEDPFDDRAPDAEPIAASRKAALGQILSYAELVFKYQQRTRLFMVDFLGDFVRLIHIDHGGLYVTRKFNYKKEGEKVAEFFWRYSRMTPAQRGHDPTAVRIRHDSHLGREMKRMAQPPEDIDERDYIRASFEKSLDCNWPWWCLDVPVVKDEGTPKEKRFTRKFLVGKPHFQAPGVEGSFVYLKDAWRVDREGIEREGSILQALNGAKIKYVPTLVCDGDIPGQATISHDLWKAYHPKDQECPLKLHQHYRLVVKEVGKPLDQFENAAELVLALGCCIDAHKAAYKAGIIHRDISAGNILLWYNAGVGWQGMLNDWELSKHVPADDAASGGRQPDRTGTWQFMSALALNDRTRAIIVPDELESLFHVLLYYAIRFLPHNCPDAVVGKFLHLYFDDFTDGDGQFNCGQMKYFAMKTGEIDLALLRGKAKEDKAKKDVIKHPVQALRFYKPGTLEEHPIQRIISTLLQWFSAYYALENARIQNGQPDSTDAGKSSSEPKKVAPVTKARSAWIEEEDSDDEGSSTVAGHSTHLPTSMTPAEGSQLPSTPSHGDAENVLTHAAMIKLFKHALSVAKDWPDNDKSADKRPKKGYKPPEDPVSSTSMHITQLIKTTSTSRKRKNKNPPKTPKKRSKA